MTPSTLCIARSSLYRTIGSELAEACLCVCCDGLSIVRFGLLWSGLSCQRAEDRYFTLRERWRAAQLEVAPDERPNTAPGGRAASTLPRRMASRRSHRVLQMRASGVPLCSMHVITSRGGTSDPFGGQKKEAASPQLFMRPTA